MKKIIVIILATIFPLVTFSQQYITLAFTTIDGTSYVQLDSIKVMNLTQDCDTVLCWNDTVLVLNVPVGLAEDNCRKDGFDIKSYPNPVTDHATIAVILPESGEIVVTVTDVLGRSLYALDGDLQAGLHSFNFIPGNDPLYFITATWNVFRKSIKVVNSTQNKGLQCMFLYHGHDVVDSQEKAAVSRSGFTFELGDELLFIGYVDTLESGMLDSPDASQLYTFQFAYGIPCPGMPTVTYEDQVYNTIQIFSQCWLKENLNVGTMIHGSQDMTNNDTIEKYCYNNEPDSCTTYGGLYQWNEMMQYTTQLGMQGICPPGWHLPSDEEWKLLEGAVDSHDGIGDEEWDLDGEFRGYDVGTNLKSTLGWSGNGNGADLFGFSGLPGGRRAVPGLFINVGSYGLWYSSTEDNGNYAWSRSLGFGSPDVFRYSYYEKGGFSVRCLKDE